MTIPGPVATPPPADNSQTAAWALANQIAYEASKPIVITGGQAPAPLPPSNGQGLPCPPAAQSQHPKWVNICPECNAQINWPCTGPSGQPLSYIHNSRNLTG